MMLNFGESGHSVFRGSSAFERADLKCKGGGQLIVCTFQWQRRNRRSDSWYSYFRQSAQYPRSSSGHMWRLCLAGSRSSKGTGKPGAHENLETMLMPPETSTENQTSQTGARVPGNLLRQCEQRFADLPEHANLTKLCSNAGLAKTFEKGQFFMTRVNGYTDRICNAHPIAQTDAEVQGNLLREYEQKFAELPEQEKLIKLCSNAGFSKYTEKGQFFIALDDDTLDSLKESCRECTLPRSDQSSQVKGWIRGNTKIGPVLDVMVCYHQGRHGVEIKIESLFGDKICSWIRIVNGINKYVTETS